MVQPVWMREAWEQLGVRERPGAQHNKDVLAYYRDAGHDEITRDEVPWCAAFVGACLSRHGIEPTGSLMARSYLKWGEPISQPQLGAVAVLKRGSDPAAGHVGFWLGETADNHILLGGNQSNAVTVGAYSKARLLGLRWPSAPAGINAGTVSGRTIESGRGALVEGSQQPAPRCADVTDANLNFERALKHVLEMEGGFTDDPDDPGGPTNKGIILAVFCRHTGRALNAMTRRRRVEELRAIPDRLVREIYSERYWQPSMAATMPAAIAFMHFDASVNHGLTGAARLLQTAVARQDDEIDIDGEIGPLTLNAVDDADHARLLADYADARRAKYRSLSHFWKFGRGWLRRVNRTQQRAGVLLAQPTGATAIETATKGKDMTTIPMPTTGKWWGSSLTVWGAAITALSTVLPILGPVVGLDVTPDVVRQAGEQFISVVQAVGGLAGTIMTIYGRTRASQPLERRYIQMHI